MFFRGTGKAAHGFRISVIMDAESRYILGYSVNTYHRERVKKGEKYSELEKAAMEMAERTLELNGIGGNMEHRRTRKKQVRVFFLFNNIS